ncbi:hypothetical protein COCON_G00215350 [Conger conger]|uniref:Uncharacterized protein n=1 Tax=Conger conger TaxID=82655 RepID=A0A9Q1CXX5_CONCO|nr:hypothetical protein COCON_G00215350 [Conger conger]
MRCPACGTAGEPLWVVKGMRRLTSGVCDDSFKHVQLMVTEMRTACSRQVETAQFFVRVQPIAGSRQSYA